MLKFFCFFLSIGYENSVGQVSNHFNLRAIELNLRGVESLDFKKDRKTAKFTR